MKIVLLQTLLSNEMFEFFINVLIRNNDLQNGFNNECYCKTNFPLNTISISRFLQIPYFMYIYIFLEKV